jgi:hypothetical protein
MAGRVVCGAVRLNADVYFGCLAHAFSTEREEVMGLLIGETIVPSDDGDGVRGGGRGGEGGAGASSAARSSIADTTVEISNLIILSRVDKRKDRCEISSQQLVRATTQAEVNLFPSHLSFSHVHTDSHLHTHTHTHTHSHSLTLTRTHVYHVTDHTLLLLRYDL